MLHGAQWRPQERSKAAPAFPGAALARKQIADCSPEPFSRYHCASAFLKSATKAVHSIYLVKERGGLPSLVRVRATTLVAYF